MKLITLSLVAALAAGCSGPKSGKLIANTHHESTGAQSEIITVRVVGEVNFPGEISLPGGARLSDAIRAAGGFTQFARKSHVAVIRVRGQMFVTDMRRVKTGDAALEHGETIYVPRGCPALL
jgi:DNA uptake protein ComE-like DNA-binding protein